MPEAALTSHFDLRDTAQKGPVELINYVLLTMSINVNN